jgi:rubredoxin
VNRLTRKERRRRRHCESECPRCGVHADKDDQSTPQVTGFTTASQIELDRWDGQGELDVEINLICPVCQVSWVATAIAEQA